MRSVLLQKVCYNRICDGDRPSLSSSLTRSQETLWLIISPVPYHSVVARAHSTLLGFVYWLPSGCLPLRFQLRHVLGRSSGSCLVPILSPALSSLGDRSTLPLIRRMQRVPKNRNVHLARSRFSHFVPPAHNHCSKPSVSPKSSRWRTWLALGQRCWRQVLAHSFHHGH